MQYSVVKYSEAIKEDRLGAEFWKSNLLEPLKLDRNWQPIGNYLEKCEYGISIEMNENNCGFPIFRMNEFDDIFIDTPKKSAEISTDEIKKFSLKKNDVLFNRTNSLKFVGRTGILKDDLEAVFASYLIRLIPNKQFLLPEYLTIYLGSCYGEGQVKRRAMESINQANVSGSEIKKVPIPIFPISFQSQIANLVEKSFSFKESSKSLYTEAESLLLEELGLQDWKPKHQLSYIKNYSDTQKAERFDAEYFQPQYDEVIEKIKDYQGGFDCAKNLISLNNKNYKPKDNKVYRYVELSNISQNGEVKGFTVAKGQDLPTRARRKINNQDLLLSSIEGSLDSISLIKSDYDNMLCSTGFFVASSKNVNPETMLIFFKSLVGQLQLKKGCSGTILTAISSDEFNKILIPQIKQEVQGNIKDKINKMYLFKSQSQSLLSIAKQAVEMAIETSEEQASSWIDEELEKLGVELKKE